MATNTGTTVDPYRVIPQSMWQHSIGGNRGDWSGSDPVAVLPSRRDKGNGAQGRGASPRTLGRRCAYEASVEPKMMRETRVFRDRNGRRVASSRVAWGGAGRGLFRAR